MKLLAEIRTNFKESLPSIALASAVIYFTFHVLAGDRGLLELVSLNQKLVETQQELAQVTSQRESLEHQVYLLRPDSLDLDLLDERARSELGLADPNDIVLFLK